MWPCLQDITEQADVTETPKTEQDGVTYIDLSALDRISDWLATDESQSALPPYDHVMWFTR